MPCRINRVHDWTLRLRNEFYLYDYKGLFLTLTYNSSCVPSDFGLVKADLQKFIKRLRKQLSKQNRSIKYFACGEYGDKYNVAYYDIHNKRVRYVDIGLNHGRPHYHAIILGVDEKDIPIIKNCWTFCDFNLWCRGKAYDIVCTQTINYVCGYVQKKIYGSRQKIEYNGHQPPFQLQSQGIGKGFCLSHSHDILKNGGISDNGKIVPLPRYYRKLLNIPTQYFDSKIAEVECDTYQKKIELFRKGWKCGLRGKDLSEFINQSEMKESNFERNFKLKKQLKGDIL